MESEMALSNELIREIARGKEWTLDQLAFLTGYSRSHCDRICTGQSVAPIEFLAALYRETRDRRIKQLLDPHEEVQPRQCTCGHCKPQRTPPGQCGTGQCGTGVSPVMDDVPADPMALIMQEISANKKQSHLLEYIYRIARDGQVNDADDTAIADYLKHSNDLIALHQRSAAAILTLRQRAGGAK